MWEERGALAKRLQGSAGKENRKDPQDNERGCAGGRQKMSQAGQPEASGDVRRYLSSEEGDLESN